MPDRGQIDELMREAFASHEAGRFDRAEHLYTAILDQDPDNEIGVLSLASVTVRAGNSSCPAWMGYGSARGNVTWPGCDPSKTLSQLSSPLAGGAKTR